jgi:hypothetical protein
MTYHADLARFYAAYQIPVFPVEIVSRPDGKFDKRPLVRAWSESASWEPRQVADWWRTWPDAAIGLPMGRLEAIALDGDIRPDCNGVSNLWRLLQGYHLSPATVVWSRTPSGGLHMLFRSPGNAIGNSPRGMPPGVDVRGAGGFIVAPGSLRSDGEAWGDKASAERCALALRPGGRLPELPPALRALMLAGRQEPRRVTRACGPEHSTQAGLERAAEHARWFVETAVPGNTNNLFNELCFHRLGALILGGDLSYEDAERIAMDAAAEHGDDLGKQRGTMLSAFGALRDGRLRDYAPPPEAIFGAPKKPDAPDGYRPTASGLGFRIDFGKKQVKYKPLPVVEGVAYEGLVTLFAGRSFSGKTTFLFSLVAASIADTRNFQTPRTPVGTGITMRPANWVYVSGERDQEAQAHIEAWIDSHGLEPKHPERFTMLTHTDPFVAAGERSAIVNTYLMNQVISTVKAAQADNPNLPTVVVFDNLQTAIDELASGAYAAKFFGELARFHAEVGNVATVLVTHPAKSKESVYQGSGAFQNRVDVLTCLGLEDEADKFGPRKLEFDKCRPDPEIQGKMIRIRAARPQRPRFEIPAHVWEDATPEWRERNVRQTTQGYYIESLEVVDRPKPEVKKAAVKAVDIPPPKTVGAIIAPPVI